jgi:hypothetical protein
MSKNSEDNTFKQKSVKLINAVQDPHGVSILSEFSGNEKNLASKKHQRVVSFTQENAKRMFMACM